MDGFIVVEKKLRTRRRPGARSEVDVEPRVNLDEIRDSIVSALVALRPVGVFVYGSVAKGTSRDHSDVDIMLILRKVPSDEELMEKATELTRVTGRSVDLVVMKYRDRLVTHHSSDVCFLDNVRAEAVSLLGNVKDIDLSVKVGKYST